MWNIDQRPNQIHASRIRAIPDEKTSKILPPSSLFEKEKHLISDVKRILPKEIAYSFCKKGSRLAHLYGLPKTHEKRCHATHFVHNRYLQICSGKVAGWEVETFIYQRIHDIQHLSVIRKEIQHLQIGDNDFLVSYVTALFVNVPLEETTQILARKKAFNGNWFNITHNLNICEGDLIELLTIATKDQLFQFNGNLWEKIDGVAMDSPLGPLTANTFIHRGTWKQTSQLLQEIHRCYFCSSTRPYRCYWLLSNVITMRNSFQQQLTLRRHGIHLDRQPY